MTDELFQIAVDEIGRNAWDSFNEMVSNFFGNRKCPNYKSIVEEMLKIFQKLGCRMSLKVHYSLFHLNFFPANLVNMNKEQRELFHQDF